MFIIDFVWAETFKLRMNPLILNILSILKRPKILIAGPKPEKTYIPSNDKESE